MMKLTTVLLTLLLFTSNCNSTTTTTPESIEQSIAALIEKNNYEEALDLLRKEDPSKPEILALLVDTHYKYGIYLEYYEKTQTMRDKMTSALRQYISALKLNPSHEGSIAEIQQIISIYKTFPDRTLPADIHRELSALGLDGGVASE